jgi:predicted lipoprotein
MRNRWLAPMALTLALALPLSGCKIVQIAEQAAAAPAGFNATAYAEGLWTEQALPHFSETARPVAEVLPAIVADLSGAGTEFGYRAGEGSPWSFVVSGTGVVAAKNTQSRAGTLEVTVEGLADPVVLQIGPVIRGNAVRDALPFVSFQDFTNQLEFADVGKALTALALAGVAPSSEAIAVGDSVSFTGAISMANASDRLQITPVILEKAAP